MDIIVTSALSRMEENAKKAEKYIKEGGGVYYRRLFRPGPALLPGDRVFFVEAGYIRGFCLVEELQYPEKSAGVLFVKMQAHTWKWIKPLPMPGFRGWKVVNEKINSMVEVVGDWESPKPLVEAA